MARQGRRPRWTKAERERVLELAAQGASQRAIAEAIFGDARLRGRVERILAAEAAASNGPNLPHASAAQGAAGEPFTPESDLELFREPRLPLGTSDARERSPSLARKDLCLYLAVEAADDAARHCLLEPVRVADGDDFVADVNSVGIRDLERVEERGRGLDFDQGNAFDASLPTTVAG
jgi:hypothetical protein